MIWAVAGVLAAVLVAVAIFAPVRVAMSAEGRADPTGAWAIAGGAEVWFFAVTAVAARGIAPRVQVHAFGRSVYRRELSGETGAPSDEKPLEEHVATWKARYESFARVVDPFDVLEHAIVARRRVRVEGIEVETSFGDPDVALVGMIAGFLHVLGSVFPRVRIRPDPIWTGESKIDVALHGKISLHPGLLAIDTLVFLGKHARLYRLVRGTP